MLLLNAYKLHIIPILHCRIYPCIIQRIENLSLSGVYIPVLKVHSHKCQSVVNITHSTLCYSLLLQVGYFYGC